MRYGSSKFGWLVASLLLIGTSQSQATTYLFDTSVGGTLPAGSVDVTSTSITVTLPGTYTLDSIAFNLNIGGSVGAGAYSVTGPVTYGDYGPFNTLLTGSFGSALTFSVSGRIFSLPVDDHPIWFAATVTKGGTTGVIAADVPAASPLPAALPMFASGLGALGLIGWRRKRTKAVAVA